MRKLVVFLGILALVIGTGGAAKVYAATYGTNVTIYDNAISGGTGWTNRGTGNTTSEDQEVEPGATSGQGWDLEAFKLSTSGGILTIIGGFNFKDGYQSQARGALFLDAAGTPPYGATNPVSLGNGTALNSLWGYNYAIKFDSFTVDGSGNGTGTYTVWKPSTTATVYDQMHDAAGNYCGDVSNPVDIAGGWVAYITGGTFTYKTVNDANSDGMTGGTHYIITGIALGFLKADYGGANPITYLHLTYECGNDNLMGRLDANTVPLPPSAILLGSGLIGLVGLGWRRRKTNV